jgi:hypothetical protein
MGHGSTGFANPQSPAVVSVLARARERRRIELAGQGPCNVKTQAGSTFFVWRKDTDTSVTHVLYIDP